MATYNVVFAGKTGTGKSSLINYLYGDKVMETGVGKPVTQRGFKSVNWEINGLAVKLFDSWGLEIGKDVEWLNLLDKELKNRDTDKPVEDWFHSVFYCIAASGHRIEDFDTKIINRFIENKYHMVVILTKADTVTEDEERELKDKLRKDLGKEISIISACSEEKILRGGNKSVCFGKNEIELQAYDNFWDSIILRLPERCIKMLEQCIDNWYEKQETYINIYTGRFNLDEIKHHLLSKYNSLVDNEFNKLKTIKQELQHTLKLYGTFAQKLSYPPMDTNVFMGLPTGETEDLEWWEWIYIIPIGIIVLPFMGLEHLICGASSNKSELTEYIQTSVSKLKEKFPSIESKIKKALINATSHNI